MAKQRNAVSTYSLVSGFGSAVSCKLPNRIRGRHSTGLWNLTFYC